MAMPVDEILNDAVNVMERYIGHEPEVVDRLQRVSRAKLPPNSTPCCPRYWIRHSAASLRGMWHGAVAECALRQPQEPVPDRELTQYRRSDEARDSRRRQTPEPL